MADSDKILTVAIIAGALYAYNTVKKDISNIGQGVKDTISNTSEKITNITKETIHTVKETSKDVSNTIKDVVNPEEQGKEIVDSVKSGGKKVYDTVKDYLPTTNYIDTSTKPTTTNQSRPETMFEKATRLKTGQSSITKVKSSPKKSISDTLKKIGYSTLSTTANLAVPGISLVHSAVKKVSNIFKK